LISKPTHKKSLFLFDLLCGIVYSAAILKEWRTVEALNASIYADVNTLDPIATADRKEEVRQA
jgi:hypothetical protein